MKGGLNEVSPSERLPRLEGLKINDIAAGVRDRIYELCFQKTLLGYIHTVQFGLNHYSQC